jgi:hypothetical protein
LDIVRFPILSRSREGFYEQVVWFLHWNHVSKIRVLRKLFTNEGYLKVR